MGRTSSLPERYGVDVLFAARGRLCGVQRKRVDDLVASLRDGRLAKELVQMRQLHRALVLVEGEYVWTNDGHWVDDPSFTRAGWWGLVWSLVFEHGVGVLQVAGLEETVAAIRRFVAWCQKPSHVSLTRRPKAQGAWGRPDAREWAIHLLQGLPGVGPELAARIVDHFGRVPLAWTCSEHDLQRVPGIGPKRASELYRALDGRTLPSPDSPEPRPAPSGVRPEAPRSSPEAPKGRRSEAEAGLDGGAGGRQDGAPGAGRGHGDDR